MALTMKMIAEEAGVSVGAAQYHYESKAALMAAVLRDYLGFQLRVIRDAAKRSSNRTQRMINVVDAFADIFPDDTKLVAFTELTQARRFDSDLAEATEGLLRRHDRFARRRIQRLFGGAEGFSDHELAVLRCSTNAITTGLMTELARGVDREIVKAAFHDWQTSVRARLRGQS
jgi:AcrR family transcriptional regulator